MPEGPLAVLDANVLYPFQLRNLLLHLAALRIYQPLWSAEIVEECTRALRGNAGLTEEQCAHLVSQMRRHFGFAWGSPSAESVEALVLPDANDRHVAALAADYEAEFIVTNNLRDFPVATLRPLRIEAIDPDAFVVLLCDIDPRAVLQAAEHHRVSLRSHPLGPEAYLAALRDRANLARTAARLRGAGFLGDAARLSDESAGG
jgi:predicted nucleic acid-binding protein